MHIVQGKPISPGYAQGRAVLFGVGELSAPRRIVAADEVEGEIERFHVALEDSRRDLLYLQERVQSELGSAETEIFTAYQLFLKDRQLIDRVEYTIRENHLGVEAAIELTVTELVDTLASPTTPICASARRTYGISAIACCAISCAGTPDDSFPWNPGPCWSRANCCPRTWSRSTAGT
jgi:phosphoenolpyruvate-protein kinase (PTS system EI component)